MHKAAGCTSVAVYVSYFCRLATATQTICWVERLWLPTTSFCSSNQASKISQQPPVMARQNSSQTICGAAVAGSGVGLKPYDHDQHDLSAGSPLRVSLCNAGAAREGILTYTTLDASQHTQQQAGPTYREGTRFAPHHQATAAPGQPKHAGPAEAAGRAEPQQAAALVMPTTADNVKVPPLLHVSGLLGHKTD